MTISPRTWFRLSLLFALGVIAISVYGQMSVAMTPCGGLAKNYPPVLALELARSVGDLHAIFGDAPSACRSAMAAQQIFVTFADCFVYIPLYTGFLVFFFLGLRARDRLLAGAGLILVLVAAAADYAENACLFHLAADPDSETAWLNNLSWITGTKWLALAIAGFLGSLVLGERGGFLNYAAFVLCALGIVVTGMALSYPHDYGAQISNGIALSWIVFLLVDLRESVRRQAARSE